ncbi:MAG: EexN family lipoprotein [Nitrosospira sp.]|nr:EexN family lipoprotein [Nitrosospira sp.]
MKRHIAISLGLSGALLASILAGCETRKMEEEVRTVDWYETNNAERAAKLNHCMSDPGQYDALPNCINASRAENNVKAGTKWNDEKRDLRTEPKVL